MSTWIVEYQYLMHFRATLSLEHKYKKEVYREYLKMARRRYHRPLASYGRIIKLINKEMESILATPHQTWKEMSQQLKGA